MDCVIISEDENWAQQLEAKLNGANVLNCRHPNTSQSITENTLFLIDSADRSPDIADYGKRIILFTDDPNPHEVMQLPRSNGAQWLLNHLGLNNNGLPVALSSQTTEGQLLVDMRGKVLAANEALTECLAGNETDWLDCDISSIFPELTDKPTYPIRRHLQRLCVQNQPCCGQVLEAQNINGRQRYLEVCARQMPGERFLLTCRDVTQRTSSHKAMRQKARYDALTGLANRQLLMDRLRMALARSKRFERQLAVMYIDLDHFKQINDTWGHAAGDAVLREASQRMKDTVREIDTVARLGGDEFVILIEDLKDHRDAAGIAEHLLEKLQQTFHWQNHEFNIGGSIGIAISSDQEDANQLLEKADLALYRAKNQGRNTFEFCTSELSAQARYKLVLQEGLKHALADDQLQLYFQPIASAKDGKVTGAEVQLRWLHPKVGMVSPKDFIPLLEQTGLIIPIGSWIIRQACQQWQGWQQQQLLDDKAVMTLNISNCQFHSQQLLDVLQDCIEQYQIAPSTLALEVSETLLLSDNQDLKHAFQKIRTLGVAIIMDDFGMGSTSFHSLAAFNLTGIKIERPLLDTLTSLDKQRSLKAFIGFAHSLNLEVIAEGIDQPELASLCQKTNMDAYQGYIYAAPMAGREFEAFLQESSSQVSDHKLFA